MAQPECTPESGPVLSTQLSNPLVEASTVVIGAKKPSATQSAFDETRQTIPGLGLGYFGTAPSRINERGREKSTRVSNNQAVDESAEEGEIAEDDFEDLYDSQEPVSIAQPDKSPRAADSIYVNLIGGERERSGSYSPFLSAEEIEAVPAVPSQKPLHRSDTTTIQTQDQVETSSATVVAMAKNDAKEAIMRLQAVNIAFEDYITEGIDKGVLNDLFSELGLEKISKNRLPKPPATSTTANPTKTADHSIKPTEKTKQQPSDATDKSEERKDRIARLLAAKKSNPTKISASTVVGKVTKPPNAKANSEKSKLLQKKMEALLKAREEKQQELERQEAATVVAIEAAPVNASADDSAVAADVKIVPQTQTVAVDSEAAKSSVKETVTSDHSLEKLPALKQRGKGYASEEPFQKPFRQTQPFLIDVSDDDQDMDVEMDSHEQHVSSLHAPTSPGRKQGVNQSSLQSPDSAVSTPTGSQDLEKMNLRIEAMKRKIAEAELKKRLKLSSPASPVASPRPKAYDLYESKESSPDMVATENSSRLPKVIDARNSSPKINRSRAASERLPLLESRRREKLLRLKALQSQVANIERELKEGLEEEKKLREELDYVSDDDIAMSEAPEPVAPITTADDEVMSAEASRRMASHPIEMPSSDHIATESSSRSSPEAKSEHEMPVADVEESKRVMNPELPKEHDSSSAQIQVTDSSSEKDAVMDEANSSGEEADDDSDGYEPAEAGQVDVDASSPNTNTLGKACDAIDSDPATTAQNTELLSAGRQDFDAIIESERETVPATLDGELPTRTTGPGQAQEVNNDNGGAVRSSFLPYESPLRYFHSYRFHPDFSNAVAGGLRSATYSNKIDALQPLCPEEALGKVCPRGGNCHFQHFAEMNAPDDQILLQLGAYTNCEASRRQEYIAGLRQLLTDYRDRKVKDFKTISQGILEYRARFQGDSSKVLPLGTISL